MLERENKANLKCKHNNQLTIMSSVGCWFCVACAIHFLFQLCVPSIINIAYKHVNNFKYFGFIGDGFLILTRINDVQGIERILYAS